MIALAITAGEVIGKSLAAMLIIALAFCVLSRKDWP
jgi:hypothetical protein